MIPNRKRRSSNGIVDAELAVNWDLGLKGIFLYISAGDGTSDSDVDMTGQNLSDLVSGMIRIDVDHPDPGRAYSIPKDNPFLDIPGARPELWAYGFRNPWRMCFDAQTGDLWVGDVGQDLWEMIEVVVVERELRVERQRRMSPVVYPELVARPDSDSLSHQLSIPIPRPARSQGESFTTDLDFPS